MATELKTIRQKEEEAEALKRAFINLLEDPEVRAALVAALDGEPRGSRANRKLFI